MPKAIVVSELETTLKEPLPEIVIFDEKTAGPDDGSETEIRSKLAQKSAVELPEESMEVDQDDEAIEFIDVIKNLGKSSGADKTLCNNFIELTKAEQKGLKSLKENSCENNIQQIKAQNCVQEILSNRLKLQHFFKCMCVTCSFTSDNATDFKNHLIETHAGKNSLFITKLHIPRNTNESCTFIFFGTLGHQDSTY